MFGLQVIEPLKILSLYVNIHQSLAMQRQLPHLSSLFLLSLPSTWGSVVAQPAPSFFLIGASFKGRIDHWWTQTFMGVALVSVRECDCAAAGVTL